MEYQFLDQDDARLLELCELPTEGGVAVALRTTGYDGEDDEVVEIAICDLQGKALFHQRVRPQNVEQWAPGDASGGLAPADVADAPELYQFEEEISRIVEEAPFVVALHGDFTRDMIEGSWVTLPPHESLDLSEQFQATHGTAEHPTEPAVACSLPGIAAYYGMELPAGADGRAADLAAEAAAVARCYAAYVEELRQQRDAKGAAHWEAYERRLEEAARNDAREQQKERIQAVKNLRINALLWLCAAAIFYNLGVQMGVRGMDGSLVAIVIAAAVFFTYKWGNALYRMYKLNKQRHGDQ